jgi:hypothetical protein
MNRTQTIQYENCQIYFYYGVFSYNDYKFIENIIYTYQYEQFNIHPDKLIDIFSNLMRENKNKLNTGKK